MRFIGIAVFLLVTLPVSVTAQEEKRLAAQVGGGPLPGATPEECARKAMQAMANEKFLFAEVDAEGNARGWNEKASVAVFTWPGADAALFAVFVASAEPAEAERLRNAICSYVGNGPAPTNAPNRIGSADTFPKGKVPLIQSRNEQRAVVPTLRFFEPGASIAFLKRGIGVDRSDKSLVTGGGQGGLAATFIGPATNALTVHFGVVAVGWDEATCTHLKEAVYKEVVKVVFE